MHSSTSNSDERGPRGPWGRTWLLAAAICAVVLGVWEWKLRDLGFRPIVPDDPPVWALARARASSDRVALLGTSRLQTSIDPLVWAAQWGRGRPPVQLAVAGGSPLPVLDELAYGSSFSGLAVVEILPRVIFDGSAAADGDSLKMIGFWEEQRVSPARTVESLLQMQCSRVLTLLSLPTRRLVYRAFIRHDHPRVPYYTMDWRRFLQLDFKRTEPDRRMREIRDAVSEAGRPADAAELEAILARIARAIQAIEARGGRVVLVHLPHAGAVREAEEQRYPPASYWDRLVDRRLAPTLDFRHRADLEPLELPDGSHIDRRDAARFTRALAGAVREATQSM